MSGKDDKRLSHNDDYDDILNNMMNDESVDDYLGTDESILDSDDYYESFYDDPITTDEPSSIDDSSEYFGDIQR